LAAIVDCGGSRKEEEGARAGVGRLMEGADVGGQVNVKLQRNLVRGEAFRARSEGEWETRPSKKKTRGRDVTGLLVR
jgi:hypothetical protein